MQGSRDIMAVTSVFSATLLKRKCYWSRNDRNTSSPIGNGKPDRQQPIKFMNMEPNNLNEWWGGQPDELKQAFSLFPDRRWEGADLHLLNNIRNYCHLKKEGLLFEDDRSMLSEIVSEPGRCGACAVQTEGRSKTCAIRTGLFWKSTMSSSTGYTMNWK